MTTLDDFKLDADITVGELRHEEIVDARLKSFNRLRVRRRNDVFAVLVGAEEWQQLTDNVRELEAQVARHEGMRFVRFLPNAYPRRSLLRRHPISLPILIAYTARR